MLHYYSQMAKIYMLSLCTNYCYNISFLMALMFLCYRKMKMWSLLLKPQVRPISGPIIWCHSFTKLPAFEITSALNTAGTCPLKVSGADKGCAGLRKASTRRHIWSCGKELQWRRCMYVMNPAETVVKFEGGNYYQCPEWPNPNCENAIVFWHLTDKVLQYNSGYTF